ncbi:hypothetical protein CRE_19226 [Caenorhabditis remanei]|uniref:Uncharacterized protein n=1 Tax=Caenorhabditis remanei TaxID=31234 RepID=E3MJJ4_CAERE|nr:hypothetical protein CRE_19226 [Caenorhabditis remanei]
MAHAYGLTFDECSVLEFLAVAQRDKFQNKRKIYETVLNNTVLAKARHWRAVEIELFRAFGEMSSSSEDELDSSSDDDGTSGDEDDNSDSDDEVNDSGNEYGMLDENVDLEGDKNLQDNEDRGAQNAEHGRYFEISNDIDDSSRHLLSSESDSESDDEPSSKHFKPCVAVN